MDNKNGNKIIDLTIVIPPLGEKTLVKCLNSINLGNVLPKEILIVIPKEYSKNLFKLKISNNAKIIYSNLKGQVAQKILGFKNAKTKFIMQLDSDIILSKKTIEHLYNFILINKKKVAVAPLLLPNINHNLKKKYNLSTSLKNYILSGSPNLLPGKITDIGYNTWFSSYELSDASIQVEWLPGGCILFHKNAIIKKNYYPFKNKAYCEDIIHSLLLTQKNVKLFLLPMTKARNLGYPKSRTNLFQRLREINVRLFILKKIRGNKIRFLIWYFLYVFK